MALTPQIIYLFQPAPLQDPYQALCNKSYLPKDNSVPQEEYAYDEFFDWIKENKEVVMGAAFVLIIAITVAIMVPTGGTSAVTIPSVLTAVEAAFI